MKKTTLFSLHPLTFLLLLGAFAMSDGARAEYLLSAPPREDIAKAHAIFDPIASFLSKVTGQQVTFVHADNWLMYSKLMQDDKLDFVFDGPQFVSWRVERHHHVPLVRLPGPLAFCAIVRKGDRITSLAGAAGQPTCTPSPPNLGALMVVQQFPNPSRQLALHDSSGYDQAFDGLLQQHCRVAIINSGVYARLDPQQTRTTLLYRTPDVPNQAVTASSRISPEMMDRIREALMSPEGRQATKPLRAEYNGHDFVPTNAAEYSGYSVYLKDTWGFEPPQALAVVAKNRKTAMR